MLDGLADERGVGRIHVSTHKVFDVALVPGQFLIVENLVDRGFFLLRVLGKRERLRESYK